MSIGGRRPNSGRPRNRSIVLGMRHNHLTVIKELERDKYGIAQYEVRCDCSNTTKMRTSHFVPERRFCTRSCPLAIEEKQSSKEVRLNSYTEEQMQIYLQRRAERKLRYAQEVDRAIKRKTGRPTPGWLTEHDWNVMNSFYILAIHLSEQTGVKYTVDHKVPMRSKYVSGLHVPGNLQIITLSANSGKRDKFEPYCEYFGTEGLAEGATTRQ